MRLAFEAVLKLPFEPVLEENLAEKILIHPAKRGGGRQQKSIMGHNSLEAPWSFSIIWVYANDSELGMQSQLAVSNF